MSGTRLDRWIENQTRPSLIEHPEPVMWVRDTLGQVWGLTRGEYSRLSHPELMEIVSDYCSPSAACGRKGCPWCGRREPNPIS